MTDPGGKCGGGRSSSSSSSPSSSEDDDRLLLLLVILLALVDCLDRGVATTILGFDQSSCGCLGDICMIRGGGEGEELRLR